MYGRNQNNSGGNKPTTTTTTNSSSVGGGGLSSSANSSSSSASASELDNILNTLKECNYTLVNSITAVEEVQREKDLIDQQLSKGTFNDEKRLKKLQYSISYESETLMKTLMKLDGLQIVGHIKHSHRIKRERKKDRAREREKDMMGHFEGVDDEDSHSRSSSTGTSSSSSSGSSSGSDDESLPKFGPHRLRKYRKRLVNRIIRLIDYLDTLSKEAKELRNKFESRQTTTTTTTTSTSHNNHESEKKKQQQSFQPPKQQKPKINQQQQQQSPSKNRSGSFSNDNSNYYQQNHQERPRSNSYNPFEFQDFGNLDNFINQPDQDYYDDDNIYNEHAMESPFFESPSQKLHKYRSNNPRQTHSHLPNFFRR